MDGNKIADKKVFVVRKMTKLLHQGSKYQQKYSFRITKLLKKLFYYRKKILPKQFQL